MSIDTLITNLVHGSINMPTAAVLIVWTICCAVVLVTWIKKIL
jgi:hypothetical protein